MGTHNDTHTGGAGHGTLKEYVTGLILSIVFTVVPFAFVMSGMASAIPAVAVVIILLCAAAQLLVQAIFFLHLNGSSDQSWNLATGTYTLLNFLVVLIGAWWIFTHLHHNLLMGH